MKKVISFLLILTLMLCCASAAPINVSSAKAPAQIALSKTVCFTFDKNSDKFICRFVPAATAYYEFRVNNFVKGKTDLSVINSSGVRLSNDYRNETPSNCKCAVKLKAKSTYYIRVTCTAEKPVRVTVSASKHTHTLKNIFVLKSGFDKSGQYSQVCRYCEYGRDVTIPKATVALSATSFKYNGKTQKPKITVKTSQGKTLTNGTDFSITYPKASKSIGRYKVTVTLKNKYYSGSKSLSYTICPADVKGLRVAANGDTTVKIKWTAQKNVSGYRIYNATTGKAVAFVKGSAASSIILSGLSCAGTYKLQIRSFKTIGGKNLYSAYSPKITATTLNTRTTVYATPTGTRYHTAACRHLTSGKSAVLLGDAKLRGLTPCHVCKPHA